MADEPGINRISLRIPADLFDRLDRKRFEEKTTFQQIGLQLFEDWLRGERKVSEVRNDEFVKCPVHLRAVINSVIVKLSDPEEYQKILQAGIVEQMRQGPKRVK